eukprot:scaffold186356_cov30-Tisochrysis_lutea.AAC.1
MRAARWGGAAAEGRPRIDIEREKQAAPSARGAACRPVQDGHAHPPPSTTSWPHSGPARTPRDRGGPAETQAPSARQSTPAGLALPTAVAAPPSVARGVRRARLARTS